MKFSLFGKSSRPRSSSEISPLVSSPYRGTRQNDIPAGFDLSGQGSFYTFLRTDIDGMRLGWKIHISISNAHITKAWNSVVFPLLSKSKIGAFKIVKNDRLCDLEHSENQGKVITINLSYNPEFMVGQAEHGQFVKLLASIEEGLRARNILPSQAPDLDAPLHGSRGYLFYRHDGNRAIDTTNEEGGVTVVHYNYMSSKIAHELHEEDNTKPLHNPNLHPDDFGFENMNIEDILQQQSSCCSCLPMRLS